MLQGKQFALFCLGDRAYGPQFCAAGRKLAVRLLQLGMSRCCEVGYGDDNTPNGGVFRDLDDWLEEQLLPLLDKSQECASSLSLPPNPFQTSWVDNIMSTVWEERQQQPTYRKVYQDYFAQSCPITAYYYDGNTRRTNGSSECNEKYPPLLGTLLENKRITTSDWEQDTRHLRIHLKSISGELSDDTSLLPYQAGDVATILPFNSDADVDQFLAVLPQRLQDVADRPLQLEIDAEIMNNSFTRWPKNFTLRGWLKHCADIHSLPEREDLRALSFYCSEEHETGKDQRDKLRSLADTSEAALYADYVLREKRSWADVLYDFESLRVATSKLSIHSLLSLLPPIRTRDYSIASAPSKDPQNGSGFCIELCVAIVRGKTRLGRPYHGLCSDYLSRIVPGEEASLQVWIRPGSFQDLPLEISDDALAFRVPILCVAAGTGIAPMRSLLWERETILASSQTITLIEPGNTIESKDNILVFGCRKSNADFYYQSEWEALCRDNRMRLLTAFSRNQFQKVYVQKVLREADEGKLIAKHLLERKGALYIAGGPQMARAVKEDVIEALGKELAGGEKEAKQFLNKLQRLGRFSVEAWS